MTDYGSGKPVLEAAGELSGAEARLLAAMPLHAITSVHGEAGLRQRLLIEIRRGRAMMELGRRASREAGLLQEVAEMIRAPENRRLMAVGTTSISQLGAAGLVADGGETAVALAAELVGEWQRDEQSDFAWLMGSSGITWPLAE